MSYYANENIKLEQIESIWMLFNFDNQAVIGLDDKGRGFWNKIKNGNVTETEIKNNQDLYDALLEEDFIRTEPFKKEEEFHITSAYVHLLNRCNLNCLGCYSMNDARNKETDASTEQWKLGFSRLKQAGVSSIVISGGEPLLRKDIIELVRFAKENAGIENITLITNGTVSFPFQELKPYVDTIAVSVDGYDEEHPSFIRDKGIFYKIINTVTHIRDLGMEVVIVPTIHMKNYDAMKKYDALAEKLQVQISFSILTVGCNPVFYDFVLKEEALSSIAQDIVSLNADVEDVTSAGEGLCAMKSCGMARNIISVDSKGNVYPCHILHNDRLLLGNIFDAALSGENLDKKVMQECQKANVDNIQSCKKCEYRYLCGGGCRGRAFLQNGNLLGRDIYCRLFKKFHEIELNMVLQEIENGEK